MSNIKELLGDMTFEEFEEKRKILIDIIKDSDDDEVMPCEEYEQMYDIWLGLEGREFAQKWTKYNGSNGQINHEQMLVLIKEMANKFVNWLCEAL